MEFIVYAKLKETRAHRMEGNGSVSPPGFCPESGVAGSAGDQGYIRIRITNWRAIAHSVQRGGRSASPRESRQEGTAETRDQWGDHTTKGRIVSVHLSL